MSCWCGCDRVCDTANKDYIACQDCGTARLRMFPSPERLKEFYSFENYWHNQMRSVGQPTIEQRAQNDLRDRIPYWWKKIAAGGVPHSLLEIGCCHGSFLKYAHHQGVRFLTGIEPDPVTCDFARANTSDVPACLIVPGMFPNNIDALPIKLFDCVCVFDCIEHWLKPCHALFDISRSLMSFDGRIVIQTPLFSDDKPVDWPQFRPTEHVWLFSNRGIGELLGWTGFRVRDCEPGLFPHDIMVIAELR